jgi:hypothetical protein
MTTNEAMQAGMHGKEEQALHISSYRTYVLVSMREFVHGVHGVISLIEFGGFRPSGDGSGRRQRDAASAELPLIGSRCARIGTKNGAGNAKRGKEWTLAQISNV